MPRAKKSRANSAAQRKPDQASVVRPRRIRKHPARLQDDIQTEDQPTQPVQSHTSEGPGVADMQNPLFACLADLRKDMARQQEMLSTQMSHMTKALQNLAGGTAANKSTPPPSAETESATSSQIHMPTIDDSQPSTSTSRTALQSGMPLGSNVKDSIKSKIWQHKYIDLFELLHPQTASTFSLSFASYDSTSPSLQLTPQRKRPLTENEWATAMDIYMAVYVQKFPQDVPNLLTYIQHIKDLMRHGADWLMYDTQFRIDREFTHCSWSSVRQDLELRAFRSLQSPKPTFRPQSTTQSNFTRVPTGYCFSFHQRGTRCYNQNCRYKHLCPKCSKPHPLFRPCRGSPPATSVHKTNKPPQPSKFRGASTTPSTVPS